MIYSSIKNVAGRLKQPLSPPMSHQAARSGSTKLRARLTLRFSVSFLCVGCVLHWSSKRGGPYQHGRERGPNVGSLYSSGFTRRSTNNGEQVVPPPCGSCARGGGLRYLELRHVF
jgi:hypothetical protein